MLASLSLLVAGGACAQETGHGQLPEAPVVSTEPAPPVAHQDPVVFHKRVFWTLAAVEIASAVADAQASYDGLQSHPMDYEHSSWLLGRRPSLGRYYATFAVQDGGSIFISDLLLHSRHKPLRLIGWGLFALSTGNHLYGVAVTETE